MQSPLIWKSLTGDYFQETRHHIHKLTKSHYLHLFINMSDVPAHEDSLSMIMERLVHMFESRSIAELQSFGGTSGLVKVLDLSTGIASQDMRNRMKARFGCNELPEKNLKSWCRLALDAARDHTLMLLMGASSISIAIGVYQMDRAHWMEGIAILVVNATNGYSKERQFQALNANAR
jgi:magnesium-transporting ATPase (P-type)